MVSLPSLPRMPERSGAEGLEEEVVEELEWKGFLPFTAEVLEEDVEGVDGADFELEDEGCMLIAAGQQCNNDCDGR